MSQFKTKEFLKLKKKWYNKLDKDGFKDAEHPEKDQLLRYDDQYFKAESDPVRFAAKQQYYQNAAQFLWDYNFPNDETKLIWQLHSEGKTYKQISEELKRRRVKRSSAGRAYLVVKELVKEMLKKHGE